jgi:ubiquinone/menaquinone biosynthesis C-methylase UbiE
MSRLFGSSLRSRPRRGFALGAMMLACAAAQDPFIPIAPAGEPAASFPAPSRPVADIVAPRWTDEDDRDDAGEFTRVAQLANVKAGMHVADIGAGDGYYVARLSPIVGATGRVYGQDIVPSYLALLQRRVRATPLANTIVALGEPHDPRLPAGALDLAFMIHMYHEIEQPFGVLWNLATAMKPGGRLVILDLERPTYGHGTPITLLRCELRAVGYIERSFTKTDVEEYVAIFEAPSTTKRPTPAALRAALSKSPCRAPR